MLAAVAGGPVVARARGGQRPGPGSFGTRTKIVRAAPRKPSTVPCQATDGRHSAADAELHSLMLRLREDDVEYFDLKTLCKERQLGGRDSKDNLRAKLLRSVRQELGLPVFGPDNVPPSSVRLPQNMNEDELRQLFESRGCMMPNSHWQVLSMANALLIADNLLDPSQVMWPDAGVQWSSLTVAELKQECTARKLSTKGLKDELIERLKQWDAQSANEAAMYASSEAAAAEAAAAEGIAPSATNNAVLQTAQELFASLHRLEIGQLRDELSKRGLKAQGTKQILLAKLTEALEKDVARALGGERRLTHWAASAVGRLTEAEVQQELEARGVVQYTTPAEAAQALQALMQKDWVNEALHSTSAAMASSGSNVGMPPTAASGIASAHREGASATSSDVFNVASDTDAGSLAHPFVSGRADDPQLSVALLCGGSTESQRNASLAAARLAVHYLQSNLAHGLLPRQPDVEGSGGQHHGLGVHVYYASSESHFCLTWEQLHNATAAELDVRLTSQTGLKDITDVCNAADVIVPLGLSAACHSTLAAAGKKVAGSAGSEVATLALDRLAFTAHATGLGFSCVPVIRLQLVDFTDAGSAQQLGEIAAYGKVEAWLNKHSNDHGRQWLAVRAEVAGSVLGGCLVSGVSNVLLAALALMQEHMVSDVVVEVVHPDAHHFTCTVLATDQGAVALPPTELSYYDLEEAISDSELELERFLAIQEGLDVDSINAVLTLLREERQAHPGYLGGPGSASQQLRQFTPPVHLSAAATEAIRQASVKLFQQLGLRDYAQFAGWVLRQHQGTSQAGATSARTDGITEQEEEGKHAGKGFAELLALDMESRTARQPGGGGPAQPINSADRAAALDTSGSSASSSSSGLVFVEETAAKGTYGTYNGIPIDDTPRTTCEEALEAMLPFSRPIPLQPPPEPVVTALEDLSGASPQQLCQINNQQVVAFAQLSVVPDLGSPTGVLCQQAAAVGLTHEAILRHLVSSASIRAGGQPLPPLPEVMAAAKQRAAEEEQEAADVEDWSALGRVAGLDDKAVKAFLQQEVVFSWAPAVQPGSQPNGSVMENDFAYIDATQDPFLDPIAPHEQGTANKPPEAPLAYDEIAAGVAYDEAGAAEDSDVAAAADWEQQQLGGHGMHLTGMHPTKQRVWVLLGGDGPQSSQSLQAGLHAYLSLRNNTELLVEVYMLEPSFAGNTEAERRQQLLDKRLELLKMGMHEEWILQEYPYLDLTRIRHPPPGNSSLESRGVWRLSDSGTLRAGVDDMQTACEAALATATASLATLEEQGGDIAATQLSVVKQELAMIDVSLDGSPWGGARADRMTPAKYNWLHDFAAQAREAGALVFLALSGQSAAYGPLQRMLDDMGVPYTGSGHIAAETCADKPTLMEQLLDLEASGISTAPQQKISLPELSAQCENEAAASRLFEQLRVSLGAGTAALCIKPAISSNGLGVMRVANARDLMLYAQAVEAWADLVPGEALSCGTDVAMPVPPPSHFAVEPFVTTEPVQLRYRADGSLQPPASLIYPDAEPEDTLIHALHWPAGSNQWLQISATLLGAAGRMRCLGPSVRVLQLQEATSTPLPGSASAALQRVQHLVFGDGPPEADESLQLAAGAAAAAQASEESHVLRGVFELTPPPATLVLPEAVSSARVRLEIVADRLGLSGAAEVSAYMHSETGEVVISDVSTLPDLSPGALIFRQAACADPPLSPAEVFHDLIRIGLTQPLEERDELQALGFSEVVEEGAAYDYPRDSGYSSTWSSYDMDRSEWSGNISTQRAGGPSSRMQ